MNWSVFIIAVAVYILVGMIVNRVSPFKPLNLRRFMLFFLIALILDLLTRPLFQVAAVHTIFFFAAMPVIMAWVGEPREKNTSKPSTTPQA